MESLEQTSLEQTTLQNPANSIEPTLENGGLGSGIVEPEAPAAAPEKLTRKQIGQLRRQYLTVTHGRVKACDHLARFSKDHDPKNNCVDCWAAYLMTCVDLDFVHTVLSTKGVAELVKIKGKKFVRMFHGWLSSQLIPALAEEIPKIDVASQS